MNMIAGIWPSHGRRALLCRSGPGWTWSRRGGRRAGVLAGVDAGESHWGPWALFGCAALLQG